ncbi:MAG: antirestriction protein ArdA [Oscillospiraceae bacterium]|nr:antirestriction protein ArdA [Oscillospiraceae bacterium]MDE7171658.1 antirestriction protein ArdA [Oscillospiraceae bacterium]
MAEFTANIANLGKYSAGVLVDTTLSFPTTKEQVQAALREIGVDGLRYQEIIILEYSIGVKGVARALGEFAHLDELNYLASRINSLDPEELLKFTAAVEHGEYASSAEDLINLTYNLDRYELYPVQNAEEYGLWLVDELLTMELPEQARDYFDFEAYGEATAINEGGTFTAQGYMLAGPEPFQKVYDGQHIPEQYKVFQYPIQQKITVPRFMKGRDSPGHKRP